VAERADIITRAVKTYTQKFTEYIKQNTLFYKGDSIVIALSGGPDSVFLLYLLYLIKENWKLKIVVAHFNHLLRGNESNRDAKFSRLISKKLNFEFYSGKGDVNFFAKKKKLSIQEAARHLRYKFLYDILKKSNCKYIATAHTADDQAEEILLRLIRGTGISGISGIKPKNKAIIRPLLNFSKEEILFFLNTNNIKFCLDSSNFKDKYLRNKIRLKLMPFLKKNFNPNILKTLNKTALNLYYDYKFIENYLKAVLKTSTISLQKKEKITLSVSNFIKEPINIRTGLYKAALKNAHLYSANISSKHLLSIDNLLFFQKSSSLIHLPAFVVAKKEYNNLIFEKINSVEKNSDLTIFINAPGKYYLPDGKFFEIKEDKGFNLEKNNDKIHKKLWISSSKATFPFLLRKRLPGDRFMPLGMENEFKLKDFFINRKIPLSKRNEVYLLIKNKEIIAITGIEISEKYKIFNNNESSYRISIFQ